MLPIFLAVVAFIGIDGRTFGQTFQQRRQVVALMGVGGGDEAVFEFGIGEAAIVRAGRL